MKLGKLILGAGVVTSALAVSAGLNTQSAAAEETAIASTAIKMNFATQKLNVTNSTNDKLYVGVGAYKASAPSNIKVKNWVVYDANKKDVAIDTSSLAVTKDQYIAIKGDKNTKVVVVKLPKAISKLSASVDYTDTTNPQLKLKDISGGKATATDVNGTIEYSEVNGDWQDFKTSSDSPTDLTQYQKFGATLKVREKASVEAIATDATDAKLTLNNVEVAASESYKFTGNFATKELRVKIAKLAAGPRVSVNYLNNTIAMPKTAEYRIAVGNFSVPSITTKTKLMNVAKDFGLTANNAATIDIRTKAVANSKDATKSKPASNITEVAVAADVTKALKVSIESNNFGTTTLEGATAGDNDEVSFKYGDTTATGTFTNKDSTNAYDIYITNSGTYTATTLPESDVTGVKKLAAGLGRTLTVKGLKEGDKIYIRKAGNKSKKEFASKFGAFGTVKAVDKPASK